MPDQAHGLRRMFAASGMRFIPLVSNPHLASWPAVLETVAASIGELGHSTLVVDAAESAPAPGELARLDLAQGIEVLSPALSYLPARGLPLSHVDANGSSAGFLEALAEAAPTTGVVLLHASASDLARLFAHRTVRPLLLAGDRPDAVMHAYAAMKLLAMRAGLMAHDLLLCASAHSPRADRIAAQMARCADAYSGAALHDWVRIDPAESAAPSATALRRLVRELLDACEPGVATLPVLWRTPGPGARHAF